MLKDFEIKKALSVVVCFDSLLYKTNRFHVAVRLFSNRSQMTSKCGKNKKVAHEAIAECVTDGIYLLNGCTREVAKHERSVRVARGDSRVRL